MSIRAKFQCDSIERNTWSTTAKLSVVTGGSDENKDFNDATPSGKLEIEIKGDVPANGYFEPGEHYYLDFTKAE